MFHVESSDEAAYGRRTMSGRANRERIEQSNVSRGGRANKQATATKPARETFLFQTDGSVNAKEFVESSRTAIDVDGGGSSSSSSIHRAVSIPSAFSVASQRASQRAQFVTDDQASNSIMDCVRRFSHQHPSPSSTVMSVSAIVSMMNSYLLVFHSYICAVLHRIGLSPTRTSVR